MFTGIIEDLGTLKKISKTQIAVETKLDDIKIGDSVSVHGICLTVAVLCPSSSVLRILTFDVSEETFNRTTLRSLSMNEKVNLERAMKYGGRFGGHIVTGHVDEVGKILSMEKRKNSLLMSVKGNLRYIIERGSVAVNGASLTVADIDITRGVFKVALIPHTLENTALKVGAAVNIEYDMFAKYACKYAQENKREKITLEKLRDEGFF